MTLYDPESTSIVHHVNQGCVRISCSRATKTTLCATAKRCLIDEFTGRMMAGRRLSDGLHQAIEAKEGVPIQA